jgi:hypothetical protein
MRSWSGPLGSGIRRKKKKKLLSKDFVNCMEMEGGGRNEVKSGLAPGTGNS